ncbi:MAG TPA: transposase [Clostridiales bacterium]|jgi:transposase|nr:transposase [Clostridiales bacterium]
MMGKKDGQMQIMIVDMDALIPENHLLKRIDNHIDFDFIYEKAAPYYSNIGRKSIDPVCMVKMLLVGYLYGIKSERRLTEDVALNLAYRWFCGFDLTDKIPNHSLFSQNRRRRFTDSKIFNEIFNHIVRLCIEKGIVTGEAVVSDGSFIPANVSAGSLIEIQQDIEQSTVHYLDSLDDELKRMPGYKEPEPTNMKRELRKVLPIWIADTSIKSAKKGLVT